MLFFLIVSSMCLSLSIVNEILRYMHLSSYIYGISLKDGEVATVKNRQVQGYAKASQPKCEAAMQWLFEIRS